MEVSFLPWKLPSTSILPWKVLTISWKLPSASWKLPPTFMVVDNILEDHTNGNPWTTDMEAT